MSEKEQAIENLKTRMNRISVARAAIIENLKERFKAQDPNVKATADTTHWHKPQANYFSGSGAFACPVCKTGTLQYSRSSYNGHVHARCSTKECVAWME